MFQPQKLIITAIAASALSLASIPSAFATKAYLTDSAGGVAKDSDGDCWRTGIWTPETAIEECDPELFTKAEPEPVEVVEEPIVEPEPVVRQILLEADTLFAFDKSDLTDTGRSKIAELVDALNQADDVESIEVNGHTDSVGSDEYNQSLSERRAASVQQELVNDGIDAALITTNGYGESRPAASNDTKEGRQMNRRAEINITAKKTEQQ